MQKQYRIGFKGRYQLPLFMVWVEYYEQDSDNEPSFARVVFNSMNWIGI